MKFINYFLYTISIIFLSGIIQNESNAFENVKFGKFTPLGDKKYVPEINGEIAMCNKSNTNISITAETRVYADDSCKTLSWVEVHDDSDLYTDIPFRQKLYKLHSLCSSANSDDALPTVSEFVVGVDLETRHTNAYIYEYVIKYDADSVGSTKLDQVATLHACKPALVSGVNLTADDRFYAAIQGANIRPGPSTAFSPIGKLKAREIIHAVGRAGNWIGFEKNGEIVFVWNELLIETASQYTDRQRARQELIRDRHRTDDD